MRPGWSRQALTNPKDVQGQMRYSRISTTMDIYVRCLCVGILFPGGISSVATTSASEPVLRGSTLKKSGLSPSSINGHLRQPERLWASVAFALSSNLWPLRRPEWHLVQAQGWSEQIVGRPREAATTQDEGESPCALRFPNRLMAQRYTELKIARSTVETSS
jgi:hypothetical protein